MSSLAIHIQDLLFSYEQGSPILQIKELQIKRGEHVFLYGPSGCGKTTLLGLLSGVLPIQTGQLHILGRDFREFSLRKKDTFRGAHIGYIFQLFNLIPYLNVMENILLPLSLSTERKARVRGHAEDAVLELAKGLDIVSLLEKTVQELSVGQQQRVAAARALIGQPEIVIADEPTSALDYDRRREFIQVLFDQADRHETTIIFVSHDYSLRDLFHRAISLPDLNLVGKERS